MKFNLRRFFKRKKKGFRIPTKEEYLDMDVRKERKRKGDK